MRWTFSGAYVAVWSALAVAAAAAHGSWHDGARTLALGAAVFAVVGAGVLAWYAGAVVLARVLRWRSKPF